MNKQRKVVITTTYNEMGIIIDTKAEEVAQPEVAKDTNVLTNDCISRQAAIDALDRAAECWNIAEPFNEGMRAGYKAAITIVLSLPSAQPEEASMILGASKDGVRLWYQCSACGEPVNADDNYCCNCGRKFING